MTNKKEKLNKTSEAAAVVVVDTRHSNPMRVRRRRVDVINNNNNSSNKMPTKTKLHIFHSLVPTAWRQRCDNDIILL